MSIQAYPLTWPDNLPAPTGERPWREVLGIHPDATVTRAIIQAQYRGYALSAHLDAGGCVEAMAELNAARAEALKEIGI